MLWIRIALLVVALSHPVWGNHPGWQAGPQVTTPYLGETPPGDTPTVFAPGVISGVDRLHGTPVFSPQGSEVYWSAVDQETGKVRILSMKYTRGRWSPPAAAPFSTGYQDDVPFIAPDGESLYFVSDRPMPGERIPDGEHVWRVRKTPGGWSEPMALDASVNSMPIHWQLSVAADATLFFATDGVGDIYAAPMIESAYGIPIRLGGAINTDATECCPFVTADDALLLFARTTPAHGADLYASFRTVGGSWSDAVNLGRDVNTDGHDLCPIVSPDGKYLFFLSQRGGMSRVYWVSMQVVEKLRPAA